jgi:hypothetical protein
LQGLEPQRDPYTLDNLLDFTDAEQRKIVKGIVLNAINAKSPKAAILAFRQDQKKGSIEKSMTDQQLQLLLDAFKEKHPSIADSICTDKGVELMAVDGRITAKVINHFTKRQIPVLTVHDSYITPHTHTGELRRVMNDAVAEELNGFKINVDQEGIGFDQIQTFKNLDRANALDYDYNQIVSYNKTEGYQERLKRHNQWLTVNGIQ